MPRARSAFIASPVTSSPLISSARFSNAAPRGDAFGTPYSPTHQLDLDAAAERGQATRTVRVRGDASNLTLLVPVRESARATLTVLPFAAAGEDGFAMVTVSPPSARPVTPITPAESAHPQKPPVNPVESALPKQRT